MCSPKCWQVGGQTLSLPLCSFGSLPLGHVVFQTGQMQMPLRRDRGDYRVSGFRFQSSQCANRGRPCRALRAALAEAAAEARGGGKGPRAGGWLVCQGFPERTEPLVAELLWVSASPPWKRTSARSRAPTHTHTFR